MKIKINNPCPEDWETMQDSSEGKFCDKCSKCVVDFTDKTADEVQNIFNDANGKEICGRISSNKSNNIPLTLSVVLILNVGILKAQSTNISQNNIEQTTNQGDVILFSGKLIDSNTERPISEAEIYFIHLKKYFQAATDSQGFFSIEIPKDLLNTENVISIDFEKANTSLRNSKDSIRFESEQNYILPKWKILSKNQIFKTTSNIFEIGAVVIVNPEPPDYYYFNGKKISKRRFERLQKENPQYKKFVFSEREGKVIANINYLSFLSLLYSD